MNTSQHIAAQNKAIADFESLALSPWRAGSITGQSAINQIEAIAATFEALCAQLGYARAIAGAADVRNLAETLKASIRTGAEFPPTSVTVDTGGAVPLVINLGGSNVAPHSGQPSGGGVSAWVPLVALAILFLLSRRSH